MANEQSVQLPWAPGAKYTKITCRLGTPVPDAGDVDSNPDLMTMSGTVRLTCSAKQMKYVEADGRSRMLSTSEWLFKIRASDGELVNTDEKTVGVMILSPYTQGLTPNDFTWKAVVTPAKGDQWTVDIPATDAASFDLVEAFSFVPGSSGSGGVKVVRTKDGVLSFGSAGRTTDGSLVLGG